MDLAWAELYRKVYSVTSAECERIWLESERHGIRWSYFGAPDYPAGWTWLEKNPPLVFSYQGDPVWAKLPTLSVVGSRTPMRDTCLWMQLELSRFLAIESSVVVSGGARGVDQWAHRICMDMRRPTVCIFPSGLLKPYPSGFSPLGERILQTGGALVSTFPLHQEMRKRFFIERNRWIAGMSSVTFVAEANRRSGSALTGSLAFAAQREVCTLPVFPRSGQGLGNLDLITGTRAHLIRDHQDLLGVFRLNKGRISEPRPKISEES